MTTIKQPTSSATETILAQNAEAIRALGKRVIGDIIKIGRLLTEAKKIAGHGNWLPWIKREFGWTDKTAQNFMSVHAMALKNEKFSDLALPVSGLYALAAPSTPEEAREVVVARAESGERLSNKDVRNQINETRKKTATKTAAPAQTESAIPIYGPCAGECVVTRENEHERARLASQQTTTTADKAPEPKMKKSGSSELLNSRA